MKQMLRKILAVLVVLSIVLSVGIIAISGSAAETVVFEETFDTGAQSAWADITRSTVENGKLHMAAVNRTTNGEWITTSYADYTVEADIQFDEVGGTISGSTATAGIMGRVNPANIAANRGDGYEFALYVATSNLSVSTSVLKVRLYERGNDTSFGTSKMKNVADLLGAGNAPYNGVYRLKMVFKGSSIKCYINDVLAFDETDTSRTEGYSGVRSTTSTAYVDNFKITTEAAGSVSSAVSSEVSSTPSTPAGPLFFDDFNTGTIADHQTEYGWSNSNTGDLVDGRYFIHTERHTSRYNYLKTITALNPYFNYANCTTNDYTVEADVQFKDYTTNSFIGLVSRVTSATSNGYEFGIAMNGAAVGVRLRKVSGGAIMGSGSIVPLTAFGIQKAANDVFHLKMTVLGSRIVCYVDGVKVYDETDTSCVKGVPAIRVAGGNGGSTPYSTGYVDNFKVTEAVIEDDNTSSATSSTESSSGTSSGITSSEDISSGGKYHFEDNFNSGSIHADWAYDTGSVVNGVYHLNAGGGSGNSNWVNTNAAKNLTNFAVQGDFTILSVSNGSNQPTASLSIRTQTVSQTGTTGQGYEYAITYVRTSNANGCELGKLYVRLFERSGTAPSIPAGNVVPVEDILGEGNAPLDGTYTLRAEVIGNRIKCFINGYEAFDMTDDTWASGAFGIRSTVNEITADNIVVDEIDTFTTGLPPVSGGDRPTYTYPEGVYYQDDFSTEDFTNKGWNRNLSTSYGQVKMYDFTGAYLTKRADMMNLTDYTVEAWISIDDSEPSKATGRVGAIVARAPAANMGYEFGLYQTGSKFVYRLYDRTNGVELAAGNFAFAYNESYRLRLVVKGNQLYGYIGDQLVMSYTDTENRNPVGTAGMRQLGLPVYYDDYIVRVSTEDEKNGIGVVYTAPQADKNGIYFSDNFNTKASVFDGTWNDSNATFENGKMHVAFDREANLGGNPGFAMLKDYVVQADVTVTNMKPIKATSNIVSLVARGNYEFNLVYSESGSGYLRLYDRANSKPLTDNHTYKVEQGKTYTLSLMVEGSKIRAFMNGELIFEKEDAALTDGIMGVRTKYTATQFDNFVVRKITAADRANASINTGTTPSTGDTMAYVTMAVCAMLLAAATLLLSKRRSIVR